jgi:hypothetical protein
MKSALLVVMTIAAVVVIYGLHRLALYAEGRGWIYYTKAGSSSGSLSNAFLEVQSLIEPSKRHVVMEQTRARSEQDDDGAPPDPEPSKKPLGSAS